MWNNESIWNLKRFHAKIEEMQKFGDIRLLHLINKHGPQNGAEILNELQNAGDSRMQQMNHMNPGSFGCGPRGGAEILNELRNSSDPRMHHMHPRNFGYSKLSPSYLYPALKKMEFNGLISKNKEDKYELTEKGKNSLNKLHEFFQTEKGMTEDPFTLEDAFTELDSYVDYLEDTGKEKLKIHSESLENLIERLKNIKESVDNN